MSDRPHPRDVCPVVIRLPVAWGEMDAFGHVNNTVYFRYFESGRIAYFERIRYMEVMDRTGVGPILASASCRFRRPLAYPDTVEVGTHVQEIHEDRFTVRSSVWSGAQETVVAEGEATVVSYDYEAGGKAPLQPEIRERIEGLEASGREGAGSP